MAKIQTITRISDYFYPECAFWTENGSRVLVELCEEGVTTVHTPAGADINEFCALIAECANQESNFGDSVLGVYGAYIRCYEFKGIKFTFNDKEVFVPKGSMTAKDVYDKWNKAIA